MSKPTGLLGKLGRSLLLDLRRALHHTVINRVAGSSWVPRVLRMVIYRAVGIGARSPNISFGVTFMSRDVTIGADAFVNWGVLFEGGPITIGERTMVGQQTAFITADHPLDAEGRPTTAYRAKPIEVGADCWLGARVTVLGGVTIADGCVVAAGSVVNRDLSQPGTYAGVPARLVRPAGDPAMRLVPPA
jgi:maltose O-acetyltransferase